MIPQFSETNAGPQRSVVFQQQAPRILSHVPMSGIRPPPSRRKKAPSSTAPPLAATKSRFCAALRSLQKLDALLVSIEQLGPSLSEPSSPRN
jgi:hypothetical protein